MAALLSSMVGTVLSYVLLTGAATKTDENHLQGVVIAAFPHAISLLLLLWLAKRGLAHLTSKLVSTQTQLLENTDTPHVLQLVPTELDPLAFAFSDQREKLGVEIAEQRRLMDNISNQLRGPLTVIKTYTGHALQLQEPEAVKNTLGQLDHCVDKVLRTFDQINALNKAGRKIESSPVDLNFVISDAIAEFVDQAITNDIDLIHELSHEPAIVYGDWPNLHELARNLIENALNATGQGGLITVRVRKDDCIILSVTDTGNGIPESDRERAFQPFHRIKGTSDEGGGLGLADRKSVV